MYISKPFTVNLSRTYSCTSNTIHELFVDGSVFKLTGADEKFSDFKNENTFRLIFSNRGEIFGHIIKNEIHHLIFEWNVKGFDKPEEINRLLDLNFMESENGVELILQHSEIKNSAAAEAKLKAWTEILKKIDGLF